MPFHGLHHRREHLGQRRILGQQLQDTPVTGLRFLRAFVLSDVARQRQLNGRPSGLRRGTACVSN
ncbi:MAG: hypothetical protein H0X11_11955 [Betaproteobacteria bacterium]|nr:hypothetical protein [Betaproteobacteria bacterium]